MNIITVRCLRALHLHVCLFLFLSFIFLNFMRQLHITYCALELWYYFFPFIFYFLDMKQFLHERAKDGIIWKYFLWRKYIVHSLHLNRALPLVASICDSICVFSWGRHLVLWKFKFLRFLQRSFLFSGNKISMKKILFIWRKEIRKKVM